MRGVRLILNLLRCVLRLRLLRRVSLPGRHCASKGLRQTRVRRFQLGNACSHRLDIRLRWLLRLLHGLLISLRCARRIRCGRRGRRCCRRCCLLGRNLRLRLLRRLGIGGRRCCARRELARLGRLLRRGHRLH